MTYSTPTRLEYRGLAHAGGIEGELNFMARDKTWKYISVCFAALLPQETFVSSSNCGCLHHKHWCEETAQGCLECMKSPPPQSVRDNLSYDPAIYGDWAQYHRYQHLSHF